MATNPSRPVFTRRMGVGLTIAILTGAAIGLHREQNARRLRVPHAERPATARHELREHD